MTDRALQVLARLADGKWHSGPALSDALGVSRAAIWKQVETLRGAGLPVASDPQQGYRLERSIELLASDRIESMLDAQLAPVTGPASDLASDPASDPAIEVIVLERCGSTNAELAGPRFRHRRVVLAEWQDAGRGRRGRAWTSPPGCSLALSFAYRFDVGLPRLGPLSLVAGIAAADALDSLGVEGIGLKWPNDLMRGGRKLGGLLVELQGAVDGPCDVVIGLGVNAWLPAAAAESIEQPWTDLAAAGVAPARRNEIAAALIGSLDRACEHFQREGFAPFSSRWNELDVLRGRSVRVLGGNGAIFDGVADGVSERGGLRVTLDGDRREFSAGEVSLRGRE